MKLDARRKRDDRVGDHRWQTAVEEWILPILSPARDDIGTAFEDFDHPRNVVRVVLKVAIGRHDVAAARVCEARGKRGSLTEVSAEADDSEPVVRLLQRREPRKRVVGAAVVYGDDFKWAAERLQDRRELLVELVNVG